MPEKKVVSIRTPEDIIRTIPVVFGFTPENSIAMLTFGAPNGAFHARVDIPEAHELDDMIQSLVTPCLTHKVQQVVLVAYSPWPQIDTLFELGAVLTAAGVLVRESLRFDGRTIWRGPREIGTVEPQEVQNFAATLDRTPVASRNDLATSMAVREDALDVEEIEAFRPHVTHERGNWAYRVAAEAQFLLTHDLVDLVAAIGTDKRLRDCAMAAITGDNARSQVTFWTDVVSRIVPSPYRDEALALLAFASWLDGDGARAWVALDQQSEPNTLGKLMAATLTGAVNPNTWDGGKDRLELALLAI